MRIARQNATPSHMVATKVDPCVLVSEFLAPLDGHDDSDMCGWA